MLVHLGVYSEEAYDLLIEAAGQNELIASIPGRRSDNEICVDIPRPDADVQTVISALHKAFDDTTKRRTADLLCNVLGEDTKERFDYYYVSKMKGRPLDPLKASAIEMLQSQQAYIQDEYEKQIEDHVDEINRLRLERNEKLRELETEIEEMRRE